MAIPSRGRRRSAAGAGLPMRAAACLAVALFAGVLMPGVAQVGVLGQGVVRCNGHGNLGRFACHLQSGCLICVGFGAFSIKHYKCPACADGTQLVCEPALPALCHPWPCWLAVSSCRSQRAETETTSGFAPSQTPCGPRPCGAYCWFCSLSSSFPLRGSFILSLFMMCLFFYFLKFTDVYFCRMRHR